MAKYSIEETTMQNIANGVRQVVSAGNMTPAQMKTSLDTAKTITDEQASLIAQIQDALEGKGASGGGGDTSAEDAIIDGTITEYTNSRVTEIRGYAFYEVDSLANVSFPVATRIGDYAFYGCNSLTSVGFPAATTIGSSAFRGCNDMTSVSFPAATTIGSYAFYSCTGLTSVHFPVVTYIGNSAFRGCSSLTSVNFPAATYIGSYAFAYCSNLARVTLGASSVCRLVGSNAFMSYTGWFYVPSSLIASYQAATNWTYFSSRFSAIVGS